jgi:hypothetical protein
LASLTLSIALLLLNLLLWLQGNNGSLDKNTTIIACSVVLGVISLGLFGFLCLHIYLIIKKKTTRELLKNYESE